MRYCAFLRGVNVNGTSMKMADVCRVFEKAGMKDVSSVLASGNIIFSSEKAPSDLKIILEKAMSERFSYDAFLFLKTEEEVAEIGNANPFTASESSHIYAFIGNEGLHRLLAAEFEQSATMAGEQGAVAGTTFYWKIPKGSTLGSEFGKILGRQALKSQLTSRNINTFEKIMKKFL